MPFLRLYCPALYIFFPIISYKKAAVSFTFVWELYVSEFNYRHDSSSDWVVTLGDLKWKSTLAWVRCKHSKMNPRGRRQVILQATTLDLSCAWVTLPKCMSQRHGMEEGSLFMHQNLLPIIHFPLTSVFKRAIIACGVITCFPDWGSYCYSSPSCDGGSNTGIKLMKILDL